MRIELDLSRHCLQTELKRQYNRAVSAYFHCSPPGRHTLALRIDMLERALRTLDFSRLRDRYSTLCGGVDTAVSLSEESGHWRITMGGVEHREVTTKG